MIRLPTPEERQEEFDREWDEALREVAAELAEQEKQKIWDIGFQSPEMLAEQGLIESSDSPKQPKKPLKGIVVIAATFLALFTLTMGGHKKSSQNTASDNKPAAKTPAGEAEGQISEDIEDTEHRYSNEPSAFDFIEEQGIIGGYLDSEFRPEPEINRAPPPLTPKEQEEMRRAIEKILREWERLLEEDRMRNGPIA